MKSLFGIFTLSTSLLTIALLAHHCNGEDKIVYVRPDNGSNTTCPGQSCEPLDYYAGLTNYSNNTSFIFISGLHTLSKNFGIANLTNIQLISFKSTEYAEIHCVTKAGLIFDSIKYLTVKNMKLSSCEQEIPANIYNNTNIPLSMQAAIALKNIFTLTMYSTTIQDSSGYGMVVNGLYGNSTLDNCTLVNNIGRGNSIGGNFVLNYQKCPELYTNEHKNVTVTILRSRFLHGNDITRDLPDSFQFNATGISLFLLCTNITIKMSEVILANNTGHTSFSNGGNLFILYGNALQCTVHKVIIESSIIANGKASMGGGAYIKFAQPLNKTIKNICQNENNITFNNVDFTQNNGEKDSGALYISNVQVYTLDYSCKGSVQIDHCNFTNNSLNTLIAHSGIAINIYGRITNGMEGIHFSTQNKFSITRSYFQRNHLISNNEDGGSIICIINQRKETFIRDSTFFNNSVTAIFVFRSTIVFGRNVTIRNNSGYIGGGLVLCQFSYIIFAPNMTVTFEQNRAAISGGGIYTEDQCLQLNPPCFYQVYGNSMTEAEKHSILNSIKVIMINNTAGYAGSQIFRGFMDQCYTIFDKNNTLVYKKIFNESSWKWNKSDFSYVTSSPKYICFCDGNSVPKCENETIERTIYPGEPIVVSVVAVGQFNHPTPATIVVNVSSDRSTHKTIKAICTNLILIVQSNKIVEDNVSISVVGNLARSMLRWINIKYHTCPLGTVRNGSTCFWHDINPNYSYYNATNQTIQKPGSHWIGYHNASNDDDSNITSGFIVFEHCPQLYCNNSVTSISVNETSFNQNKQCLAHRDGILCGTCKSPYTLAISSTNCLTCYTQKGLLQFTLWIGTVVIVFFVLLLMIKCNFTITDGTLSGFLFYTSMFHLDEKQLL